MDSAVSPSRTPMLEIGAMVGEYRIDRLLGQGGMGQVYGAIHPVIGKRAAIKVLRYELCADPEAIDRFVLEARAVNQIGHPNIVDVFAFGALPDGRQYMVMEWLRGESLDERMRRPVPLAEACELLLGVCAALDAAHVANIIHRDLKPHNVFVVQTRNMRPTVKLLDFGLVKLVGDDQVGRTRSGSMLGTPAYMSPEQARGRGVDHRTDLYALGVMAFELLAGSLPFLEVSAMEMVMAHIQQPPPVPSSFRPNLPPLVDRLILGLLEKESVNRPTLLETMRDLGDIIGTQPHRVGARPPSDVGVHRPATPHAATIVSGLPAVAPPPLPDAAPSSNAQQPNWAMASATNAPMANAPMANAPMSSAMANAPMANGPMANAPIWNVPISSAPIVNTPMANAMVSAMANKPMASASMAHAPMANAPMANAPIANASMANAMSNAAMSNAHTANTDSSRSNAASRWPVVVAAFGAIACGAIVFALIASRGSERAVAETPEPTPTVVQPAAIDAGVAVDVGLAAVDAGVVAVGAAPGSAAASPEPSGNGSSSLDAGAGAIVATDASVRAVDAGSRQIPARRDAGVRAVDAGIPVVTPDAAVASPPDAARNTPDARTFDDGDGLLKTGGSR